MWNQRHYQKSPEESRSIPKIVCIDLASDFLAGRETAALFNGVKKEGIATMVFQPPKFL